MILTQCVAAIVLIFCCLSLCLKRHFVCSNDHACLPHFIHFDMRRINRFKTFYSRLLHVVFGVSSDSSIPNCLLGSYSLTSECVDLSCSLRLFLSLKGYAIHCWCVTVIIICCPQGCSTSWHVTASAFPKIQDLDRLCLPLVNCPFLGFQTRLWHSPFFSFFLLPI